MDYSKMVPQAALRSLYCAYKAAFAELKRSGKWNPPKFHKKGRKESFQVVPSGCFPVRRKGQRFNIPRIGYVKTSTTLRWPDAKQVYGRIKQVAGKWWLTLTYDLPEPKPLSKRRPKCGIDLGRRTFAVVASKGEIVQELLPPKPFAKAKRRLRKLQKRLSRRLVGSERRDRAKSAVVKLHRKIANTRDDFLHQNSRRLVDKYSTIVLEDLDVAALVRSSGGVLRDFGFFKFRKQIEYKASAVGTKVVLADRFYPSSKTCFNCKTVKKSLPLSARTFSCDCGWIADRDHNAALNLEHLPADSRKVTRGEIGGSSTRKGRGAGQRTANLSRQNREKKSKV